MTNTEYHRYQKRITRDGYTPEQAFYLPPNIPRWQFIVEQEEGAPVYDVVRREMNRGLSLTHIARSFEVSKDVLCYWVRKWKKQGLL